MTKTAEIAGKIVLLGAFLAFTSRPEVALAFEARLPSAATQKLVATVQLADHEEEIAGFFEPLPPYSYRASGTVTAYPTVVTEEGDWRRFSGRRLALAVPAGAVPLVLEGEASYYSRAGCLGCSPTLTMANGQPLNDAALTMAIGAHQKQLVGRAATVTNLATGKSVKVLITDTGGFYRERYGRRVADLTIGTKEAIGMKGGLGQVRVVVH